MENRWEEGEVVVVTKMIVAAPAEMAVKGEDPPSNTPTAARTTQTPPKIGNEGRDLVNW